MKLEMVPTSRFRKDFRLAKRQDKNIAALRLTVDKLLNGDTLAPKYRDHALAGGYLGCRECHLSPDWLLIYEIDIANSRLILHRVGSHAMLFE